MPGNKRIEEKHELSECIYMSGFGLDWKDSNDIAEQLYELGYCKRSELVNEIFADIEEILSRTDWRSYWDEGHVTRRIAELKKQKYTEG